MAKPTYTCDFCNFSTDIHSTMVGHICRERNMKVAEARSMVNYLNRQEYESIFDVQNIMFLDNDYTKQYYDIIRQSRKESYSCYTENHHIVPRSLGGPDTKGNLITLTAKNHFICHYLLVHMFEKDTKEYFKMLRAFSGMRQGASNNRVVDPVLYAELKEEISKMFSMSQSGKGNSQHGTMWVRNFDLREVKKIKISELQDYIDNGWKRGGLVKDWNRYDSDGKFIRIQSKNKIRKKPEYKPSKHVLDALEKILGIQYSCEQDIKKLKEVIQDMIDSGQSPKQIKDEYNLLTSNATMLFKDTLKLKTQTINEYHTGMRSAKEQYLYDCRYRFKDDSRVPKYGPINNNDVMNKLHLVPMEFGWANNIDSSIISHPANCMIISRSLFLKSNTKYHISLEQLMFRIDAWENERPIPPIYFEKIYIPKSEEHREKIAKTILGSKKKLGA